MRSRMIAFGFVTTLPTLLLLAGCQGNDSGGGGGNVQASVQNTPTPVTSANNIKVSDGTAPLQYNFAAGGNVRVVDATSGKTLLTTRVAPQTLVRIDAASGIRANDRLLLAGPLPRDHRYEVWLDR